MITSNGTSKTMYGISRIDDERHYTHAWRVSLLRRGKRHVRNFSDMKCEGKEAALRITVEFRGQLLVKYPPISRKEFCNAKRRNNKTGITDVYKYCKSYRLKEATVKESWYWEANWPGTAGSSICKSFAVKRVGEELAKQMAIRARISGLRSVEGTFWAAERGEVPAAEKTANNSIYSITRALASEVA